MISKLASAKLSPEPKRSGDSLPHGSPEGGSAAKQRATSNSAGQASAPAWVSGKEKPCPEWAASQYVLNFDVLELRARFVPALSGFLPALLLILSLCCGPARGAGPAPDESSPKIHFRLLAWDAPVSDLSYAQEGGPATVVTLLPNGFSQPFPCLAGKPVSFFRTMTAADGSKSREEAAVVPADQLTRDVFLLFQKDPAQPGRFIVRAMPDDPILDSQVGFRFLNFSSEALLVTCAGISVALPPLGTISIQVPQSNPGEIVGVEVRSTKEGTPRLVYSNRWPYSRSVPSLVFIYQGESALQLKRIPYSPSAPQAGMKSNPEPEPSSTPSRKKKKDS